MEFNRFILASKIKTMAEGEGFEPPRPCGPPVFKTGAINHSAIPPSCLVKTGQTDFDNA